jgi:hypothetical protein
MPKVLRRIVCCAAAIAGFAAAAAAESAPPVDFEAIAINISNVGRTGAVPVQIRIERWSSDDERNKLRAALQEAGGEGLREALDDIEPRVGFIRSPGELGWDIRFARESALPGGGRRVIIATDRPMSFGERVANPRSAEYEFMVAELRINAQGKGEGKLVPFAKVSWNAGAKTIEIENYANEPVRLTEVRVARGRGADE